jgi:L-lactate utilization protein LutB
MKELIFMGMTDTQFKSYRKKEKSEYEELLKLEKEGEKPNEKVIEKLNILIEQTRSDIES